MYQAIETKYHGPSNVRGARVSATAAAGRIMVEWNDALNPEENHQKAAETFALKFGWQGEWRGGVIKAGSYVFVVSPKGGPSFIVERDPDNKLYASRCGCGSTWDADREDGACYQCGARSHIA